MYRKEINNGKYDSRKLVITDNNEVIISTFSGNIDRKEDNLKTEQKKKYQSVAIVKLDDGRFAQCTSKEGTIDWYNLNLCCKCVSVKKGENVRLERVYNSTYFKVIAADESYATIYDETGVQMTKAEAPIIIDVVFGGSGPCLQKVDADGKKYFYDFKGHLMSI